MISHMDGTPETVNNAPLPCQDQLPSQKDLIRSVGDSQASSSINGVAVGADDYPASEVELRTRSHSPAMVQPQRQHERTSSSASSPAMVRQFPSTSSFASSVDTLMASGFHIGGGSVTPTGPLPTAVTASLNPAGTVSDAMLERGLSQYSWSPADGKRKVFTKLSLANCGLRNVDALAAFRFVQTLELQDNGLTDVSILSSMPYLVTLNLSGNRLAQTPNLDPPPSNLQHLDLARNQIMTIGSLASYRYLKSLSLDRNLIKRIEGVQECRSLTWLSLCGNGVTRIENLEGLPLKQLDLRRNRIRAIENLETLTELTDLRLAHNYIASLKGLADLPLLSRLDLDDNNVSDIEELQYVQSLPLLRSLSLRKNPVDTVQHPLEVPPVMSTAMSTQQLNRHLFLYIVPNLRVLNGLPASVEEKTAALNMFSPQPEVIDALQHARHMQLAVKEHARIRASDLALSKRYRPIVLVGPAGAGKRTLTQRLLAEFPAMFGPCVSHTTRAQRPGEEPGVDYHFVSKAEMDAMVETGQFAETASFFGNEYGVSFDAIYKVALEGKICIMDLELEGSLALKSSNIDPRFVYVAPPSLDILEDRLEHRIDKQKLAAQRALDKERMEQERHRVARQQQITAKVTDKPVKSLLPEHEVAQIMQEVRSASRSRASSAGRYGRSSPEARAHGATASSHAESVGMSSLAQGAVADVTRSTVDIPLPQDEGDLLVAQWLGKARADQKHMSMSAGESGANSDAAYTDYVNQPGFFDLLLVNDDLERTYRALKTFVMEHYYADEVDVDEGDDVEPEA